MLPVLSKNNLFVYLLAPGKQPISQPIVTGEVYLRNGGTATTKTLANSSHTNGNDRIASPDIKLRRATLAISQRSRCRLLAGGIDHGNYRGQLQID
jgi:hypothetical protein